MANGSVSKLRPCQPCTTPINTSKLTGDGKYSNTPAFLSAMLCIPATSLTATPYFPFYQQISLHTVTLHNNIKSQGVYVLYRTPSCCLSLFLSLFLQILKLKCSLFQVCPRFSGYNFPKTGKSPHIFLSVTTLVVFSPMSFVWCLSIFY